MNRELRTIDDANGLRLGEPIVVDAFSQSGFGRFGGIEKGEDDVRRLARVHFPLLGGTTPCVNWYEILPNGTIIKGAYLSRTHWEGDISLEDRKRLAKYFEALRN